MCTTAAAMRRALALSALCVLVSAPAVAEPIGIKILDATYTTELWLTALTQPVPDGPKTVVSMSDTATTATPHSAALDFAPLHFVHATADTFALDVASFAVDFDTPGLLGGRGSAVGATTLRFAPVVDTTSPIGVSILRGYDYFTTGDMALQDATSGAALWEYHWGQTDDGNILFTPEQTADLLMSASLLASHEYLLTLRISSSAGYDSHFASLSLSNLVAVPEPSAILLTLIGVTAVWRRRHC